MYRKLNLDRDKVDQCRKSAQSIVAPVLRYVSHHSSTSIEAACLSLLGIQGERKRRSLAQHFIEVLGREKLRAGALLWLGRAMVHAKVSPQHACEQVITKKIDLNIIASISSGEVRDALRDTMSKTRLKLDEHAQKRREHRAPQAPLTSLLIPTERLDKVRSKVRDAVKAKLNLVSLFSSGEKGLCEEVTPHLLKEILSLSSQMEETKLGLEASHYSFPEFAVMALEGGVDVVFADPFTDILFYHVNMKRAFVDHSFARALLVRSGVTLATRDDRFIALLDIHRSSHQHLVMSLLHEAFCNDANVPPELFVLTHAFSCLTQFKEEIFHELAHAQIMREFYLRHPLHYLALTPQKISDPIACATRFALFSMIAMFTEQNIISLGAHVKDQQLLLQTMQGMGDEITFNVNGNISRRAHTLLENSTKLLREIQHTGLMKSLSEGMFANIACSDEKGEGYQGVFQKERGYFNPVIEELQVETQREDKGETHGRHRRHS